MISLVPYAPNILRVTMSTDKAAATGAPGYGFVAKPSAEGWTHERDAEGDDVFRSARMVVRVAPGDLPAEKLPQPMPLDALNQSVARTLLWRWRRARSAQRCAAGDHAGRQDAAAHAHLDDGAGTRGSGASRTRVRRATAVAATFDSPADEHYYGLGQQQKGWMDLRDHEIRCWHDYGAIGGEDVCVPFMVSSRGYGLVWDNPSKTTVDLGFNGRNVWSSEVGDRVSYFVIAGDTSDEIYEGYRLLTGVTHMLPRAVYGYIQSKAIYPTQEQILDVAKEYREKKLPLDVMVVDFLNMTKQGEMDLDPKRWPDPAAMNRELHAMGVNTLLSVWPHFSRGHAVLRHAAEHKAG